MVMARRKRNLLKILTVVLIAISFFVDSSVAIAFPPIVFEHPKTPEQFVSDITNKTNPEIKKLASALAGILVLHLLIGRR